MFNRRISNEAIVINNGLTYASSLDKEKKYITRYYVDEHKKCFILNKVTMVFFLHDL
jgi:hypothetical protein